MLMKERARKNMRDIIFKEKVYPGALTHSVLVPLPVFLHNHLSGISKPDQTCQKGSSNPLSSEHWHRVHVHRRILSAFRTGQ